MCHALTVEIQRLDFQPIMASWHARVRTQQLQRTGSNCAGLIGLP